MENVATRMWVLLGVVVAALAALGLASTLRMGQLAVLQDEGARRAADSADARYASQLGARMYEVIADAIINRELAQTATDWQNAKQEAFADLDKIAKVADTPEEIQLAAESRKRTEEVVRIFESQLLPLLKASSEVTPQIRELDGRIDKLTSEVEANLHKISESMDRETAAADKHFDETRTLGIWINAVLAVVATSLVGVLTWTTTRYVLGRLGGEPAYARQAAMRIAAGDLSEPLSVKPGDRDSLMAQMQTMQASLRAVVSAIQSGAEQLAEAASAAADSAHSVESKSKQQSDATAAMAASVEEITSSIRLVSGSAHEASDTARRAGDLAGEGSNIVQAAAARMLTTAESVATNTRNIESLSARSDEITKVVNIIKEIADQTNLLALNAAIEAARAGEQGRGFAVVADEVRKLAERTANSTSEITAMVNAVQQDTLSATQAMHSESERAQEGVALAGRARDAISELHNDADEVAIAIADISAALREQSAASTQIAQNVQRVATITGENISAVEHIASATNQVGRLAEGLRAMAGKFKV